MHQRQRDGKSFISTTDAAVEQCPALVLQQHFGEQQLGVLVPHGRDEDRDRAMGGCGAAEMGHAPGVCIWGLLEDP